MSGPRSSHSRARWPWPRHPAGRGRHGGRPGHVKKVVCEMGGKNATIIDASADLDEAVLGVTVRIHFSGQKCSACSRAIVVETAYDTFLERSSSRRGPLVVGNPPTQHRCRPGHRPRRETKGRGVHRDRLEEVLGLASRPGLLEDGRTSLRGPTVSAASSPPRLANGGLRAPARGHEGEGFRRGPGGRQLHPVQADRRRVQSQAEPPRPSTRLPRGENLYLNRGITGTRRTPALRRIRDVDVGTKAGGRDYLMHFVEPRAIVEERRCA